VKGSRNIGIRVQVKGRESLFWAGVEKVSGTFFSIEFRRRKRVRRELVPAPATHAPQVAKNVKRAWARLIRKVWAADPLACPKCGGRLRIISFIEDPEIIEKILRHLKLRDLPARPPPPRASVTLETDPDLLAWEAAGRLFDGID